ADGGREAGHPANRGTTGALRPLELVAEVVEEVPIHCAHCQTPLPAGESEADPPPMRHQVTELPPLVCVTTEYRLHARTCPACRRRTWAKLPSDVPHGVIGPRLQAVASLLTGGYGLSRRATPDLIRDLLGEVLSRGTVSAREANPAKALAAPYQEVATAVAGAPQLNVDETRWFEAHRLAWLWLAATDQLAFFRVDGARSRDAFERLLPPRVGEPPRTGTSDRYSAYCHPIGAEWQLRWHPLEREVTGLARE